MVWWPIHRRDPASGGIGPTFGSSALTEQEAPLRVTALEGQVDLDAWSPDGQTLAVHHHPVPGGSDLLMVPVGEGTGAEPQPFAAESFVEINVVFSPDGRYVAYRSNETGRSEVYIRPFAKAGPKTPVFGGRRRRPGVGPER